MDYLKILGCGSALPVGNRRPTSQIIKHKEHYLLIDCGEGTQISIREAKISFNRITHIFISHLHGDHFFGLPGLLSSFHLLGRTKELFLFGPEGLMDILNLQFKLSGTQLSYPIRYTPTKPKGKELLVETDAIAIFSFPLNHRIPCTGFLFQEKKGPDHLIPEKIEEYSIPKFVRNKIKMGADYELPNGQKIPHDELCTPGKSPVSYAFCSDNRIKSGLDDHLNGVDYLYHETTFLENEKERAKKTFHSTAKEAAELASRLEVKLLIMGHYSARYPDLSPLEAEAKEIYNEVILGKEGMQIDF